MYQKAFTGKITALLTYGEANDPAYTITDEQRNWIYHGELTFGEQRLIMSDHVDMRFDVCHICSLTAMMETKEQAAAAWEAMKVRWTQPFTARPGWFLWIASESVGES